MRFSEEQLRVIAHSQLCADKPLAEIAKKAKVREHTARYALNKAEDAGIIIRRSFVNLSRIGLQQHQLYFSLETESASAREEVLKFLVESDRVSWLGRLGGDYQYGVNLCSWDTNDLLDFLDELSSLPKAFFREKSIAQRLALTYFGNRQSVKVSSDTTFLSYRVTNEIVEIDDTDHHLLQLVTKQPGSSAQAYARHLGLPRSTVDYRLRQLTEKDIVVGHYYHLFPAPMGLQSYLLLISAKGVKRSFRDALMNFCIERPEVTLFIEALGSWDYEIVIEVDEAEKASLFRELLLDSHGAQLDWVKALPLFSYPKIAEYPLSMPRPMKIED